MSTNNTFSLPRFIRLAKQSLAHNKKLILLTAVGFCFALFMLFFFIQLSNDLRQGTDPEIFVPAFMVIFIGGGLLFTGNAFPGFRNKEKTISYLMLPASSLEKYLLEVLSRLLVLFIVLPALFWLVFHFEGFVFQIFYSEADFSMIEIGKIPDLMSGGPVTAWFKPLIAGIVFMGFLVALTGATHFERYPLVKTAFVVGILFFSGVGILYVVIEKLGLGKYNPNDSIWLLPKSSNQAITFFAIIFWVVNLVLVSASFLKIKEREV